MQVRTGGLPANPISFADAMQLLEPLMGRHYPELEARRALVTAAADERLTGYGRPERASHYDVIQPWLWPHGRIEPDGYGNYDLRFNFNGILSAWRDVHFAAADIARLRDFLLPTGAAPWPALPENQCRRDRAGAVVGGPSVHRSGGSSAK